MYVNSGKLHHGKKVAPPRSQDASGGGGKKLSRFSSGKGKATYEGKTNLVEKSFNRGREKRPWFRCREKKKGEISTGGDYFVE